ncbi:TatD family hydrolase [Mycobacterium paraintracellulare]|uniref:TatD family hydrolase n=1 Tax=Mycobacterium paraintracellulare TaxID=1138383 RepID=UPI001925B2FC|nr:TatD family hydrolase [Mycobacterium paraintracellulare]BCP02622.1 TatD family hydrolase [Mycobacterium paraintracellulare]
MTTTHQLPALDCHAHIAPDVTQRQLAALGGATVFAVTRDLDEAELVTKRQDEKLVWGIGVHPAIPAAIAAYDPDRLRALLPHFALIGEVGLDRRTPLDDGRRVFTDILAACRDQPVLISVHGTGRASAVLDEIEHRRHPGVILHWFTGDLRDLSRALEMNLYFSVNNAMHDTLIQAIPHDRILPETDFPARKVRTQRPGQIEPLEERLSNLWNQSGPDVRHRLWRNLKKLAIDSGAIETLPEHIADIVVAT